MEGTFIVNKETSKVELRFDKNDYKALPEAKKTQVKQRFQWAGSLQCWVSRSTNSHYLPIQLARELGLTDGGKTGERLPFAEQIALKAERAEDRADRMEVHAGNALDRMESLQAEFTKMRGDWSWVTQPVIRGHAGSERFGRQRDRVVARYGKGIEEYRKSEHFRAQATIARSTSRMQELKDIGFLGRRIDDNHTEIRDIQRKLIATENESYIEQLSERLDLVIEKLLFYSALLLELGGVQYSKANIKVGDEVDTPYGWTKVERVNPKSVTLAANPPLWHWTRTMPYAEITGHRTCQPAEAVGDSQETLALA